MNVCVDLNSDIGEGFGAYKMGLDDEIMDNVTSVNIACGWHAGDPVIMENTIKIAKQKNVNIGAHPSYPDLMGFGRRNLNITEAEARVYMLYQLGALSGISKACGKKIQHIKLHGAFYNTASNDKKLANSILKAVEDYDPNIILMALSGSYIATEGKRRGLKIAQEVFADRGYNDDLSLVNRALKGAFIEDEDEAVSRVIKMIKQNSLTCANGKEVQIQADSICVHGDNEKAILFTQKIKNALTQSGIKVQALDKFI